MTGLLPLACTVKPPTLLSGNTGWCHIKNIEIVSDTNANNDTPTAVDIVAVNNSVLAENLLGMDAIKWFKEKQSIQTRNSKVIKIFSTELVPLSGTTIDLTDSIHRYHTTVLLFARYNNPAGRVCTDITKFRNIAVRLSESTYLIKDKGYKWLF
jgi:hypothetical protein